MHSMLKKILELLICFLHPLAVVLIWMTWRSGQTSGPGQNRLGDSLHHPAGAVRLRADRQRPVVKAAS